MSGGDDKAVKVWDVQGHRCLHTYEDHAGCVPWAQGETRADFLFPRERHCWDCGAEPGLLLRLPPAARVEPPAQAASARVGTCI